ncbi:adenosine deaminase [Pseudooceanicola sediminis]|uniref:Adenine deaminase n=1 Tax=Pseudooceanicola sediminis TaxID=2211117 RepID=A0A399J0M0_9RHOB|nr:adenosine deaminase [Pseudooceanicola sediminis]KAA2313909.1 adenosine deaminase [Puniceibacterium sp. HSS470]RII38811.1 adenosine deaminase [Pseudooceanicola sediminis]
MIEISALPKAELHLHLEGSLEAETIMRLSQRNGIALPFASAEELKQAYEFDNLQTFLDLFYAGLTVMVTARDFYEVTREYLEKAAADGVRHAEFYVSVQGHLRRGVTVDEMMTGIAQAFEEGARDLGVTSTMIFGLQRQRPLEEAEAAFDAFTAEPRWLPLVSAIGMGGSEVGFPTAKFRPLYDRARALGWKTTVHAGEEGGPDAVREALIGLNPDRLDHGVRAFEDPDLTRELVQSGMTLTVCPLSNLRLKVFETIEAHPLAKMLRAGLKVTVNSDDPSYFGGYIGANFIAAQQGLGLSDAEIIQLARNSFTGAFLPQEQIAHYLDALEAALAAA